MNYIIKKVIVGFSFVTPFLLAFNAYAITYENLSKSTCSSRQKKYVPIQSMRQSLNDLPTKVLNIPSFQKDSNSCLFGQREPIQANVEQLHSITIPFINSSRMHTPKEKNSFGIKPFANLEEHTLKENIEDIKTSLRITNPNLPMSFSDVIFDIKL